MADTTTTNNINADGATIASTDAGKGQWLPGFDGLLHLLLVDNTGQSVDHNAAVSEDMFNQVRGKLGKYGVRPSENGTTAAAHADNSDINILRWPASVERATLVQTARIWTRAADFEAFFVDADVDTDVRLLLEPYRKTPT